MDLGGEVMVYEETNISTRKVYCMRSLVPY